MNIVIYCDGACGVHTDQIGGYAAILKYDGKQKEITGSAQNTTNNQMELMSAIVAFRAVNEMSQESCDIIVVCDSEYVVKGMNQWITNWRKRGWKTASSKPVKNKELWQELSELAGRHKVTWTWTKGHADCEDNNRCDELAVKAIEDLRMELTNGKNTGNTDQG